MRVLAHLFPNSAWMMQYLMSEHRDQLQGLSNHTGKISALSILSSKNKASPANCQSIFTSALEPLNLSCPFFVFSPTRWKQSHQNQINSIISHLKKKSAKSSLDPIYLSSYCNDLSAPLHSQISSKVFLPKLSPLSTFPIYSSASAAWLPLPSLIRNSRCQS